MAPSIVSMTYFLVATAAPQKIGSGTAFFSSVRISIFWASGIFDAEIRSTSCVIRTMSKAVIFTVVLLIGLFGSVADQPPCRHMA